MQKQAMENVRRRVTGKCLHLSPCTKADHVECCSCCIARHERMDIDNEMTLSLATVNCNEAESG